MARGENGSRTPEWKSAPFCPIIHTGFTFRAFIKNVKVFKGYNITHRGEVETAYLELHIRNLIF
jgi:hypothetical protein